MKLKRSLWQRIKDVALLDVGVLARGGPDKLSLERLEETLLEADLGVAVTERLVDSIERRAKRGELKTPEDFRRALVEDIAGILRGSGAAKEANNAMRGRDTAREGYREGEVQRSSGTANVPHVILVLGVNGAGKTTFIGKLATKLKREGHKVLVAAGDTFRAGAVDQLRIWAERSGADFVAGRSGGDPAAVGFDAIDAAIARGADTVIIDTAGRLHTSDALMEELRKVHRVVAKRLPGAPHEALLVLDGTIGQNAIAQARVFSAAVPITGLVVTKLDGTAKGGVVVAVHEALKVPIRYIGVGESADDLETFDATRFAESLFAE